MKLFIILVIFLTGCASSEYYAPQVPSSHRLTVGSCGTKFKVYRNQIDEGVVLEIYPPETIFFRLGPGSNIKLRSDLLYYMTEKRKNSVRITKIITGEFPESYRRFYDIPELEYKPLERLIGLGRYQDIDMAWGEWSSFKGKEDIFRLKLEESLVKSPEDFSLEIPPFTIGENVVKIQPINFVWEKGYSIACLQ